MCKKARETIENIQSLNNENHAFEKLKNLEEYCKNCVSNSEFCGELEDVYRTFNENNQTNKKVYSLSESNYF